MSSAWTGKRPRRYHVSVSGALYRGLRIRAGWDQTAMSAIVDGVINRALENAEIAKVMQEAQRR